jgi:hypothetical protein
MSDKLNPLNWDIGNPEADKSQIEEAAKKAYEIDHLFATVFGTPSGKKVLEWLTLHTLDTPSWWPGIDYNKGIAHGFFREGQNSLVRQIKAKIQNAKDYQEKKK